MITRLSELRLNYLLSITNELEIRDEAITKATTPAKFWQAAFQSDKADFIFSHAVNAGVYPTAEEMNEPNDEFGNAWLICIALENNCIIFELLDINILPTANAIDAQYAGVSGWHLLVNNEGGLSIFNNFISHDIWPNAESMNAISKKDKVSVWYKLTDNHFRQGIFQRLLDHEIHPSQHALNAIAPSSKESVWFRLAVQNSSRINIIEMLFNKGLYPDVSVMRATSSLEHISCWYACVRSGNFRMIDTLQSHDVCPSSQDLNAQNGIEDPSSIWYFLFNDLNVDSVHLIRVLLKAGKYPPADILNQAIWHMLFRLSNSMFNDTNKIISSLLKQGIAPTAAMLSHVLEHKEISVWHHLTICNRGLLKILFTHNIYPTEADMNLLTLHDFTKKKKLGPQIKSAWHALAVTDMDIFLSLIKLGIIPDEEVMNTPFGLDPCTTVWWLLRGYPYHDNLIETSTSIEIYLELFYRNILPNSNSFSYLLGGATRINKIDQLEKKTNRTKKHNPIAVLLTRDDVDQYYGFICFLYTLSENKIQFKGFPQYDMILYLARSILPRSKRLRKSDIFCNESREVFLRYHAQRTLRIYMQGSFFDKKHNDRAQSLLACVEQTNLIRESIMWQSGMMISPGKSPYPQKWSQPKHTKPYSKAMKDDKDKDYKEMMTDLYRVARGLRIAK